MSTVIVPDASLYAIDFDLPTRDFKVTFASGAPAIWRGSYLEAEEAAREALEHDRRALENLEARQEGQANDLAETRARFDAEGAAIDALNAANEEYIKADRAYESAGDDYERLWAYDWVADALEALEEAEQALASLEAAPRAALSPATLDMAKAVA